MDGTKKGDKNSSVKDSGSKIIFRNPELCSQLLRGYTGIPQLADVKAEDIEDVSERYVHMFTEEREADTVKKVKLSEEESLFMISLIEHKSYVDYNVIMQLLRYMVYIWEDYEKDMERKHRGVSKSRDFKYPPILPIVYYEGAKKWSASCRLKDRMLLADVFAPYLPDFTYKLIQLSDYSREELVEKKDDLSLVMLINQIQSVDAFSELELPEEYLRNLSENSPAYLKDIVAEVVAGLLRHLKIPEQEILDFTGQVKEQKMGMLFENFKDFDFPAEMKKAREEARTEGLAEGRTEGLAEGRAEGLAEGISEGREKLLIGQVCRKLQKGKTEAQIADELEEAQSVIEAICRAAVSAPGLDVEQIWLHMHGRGAGEV